MRSFTTTSVFVLRDKRTFRKAYCLITFSKYITLSLKKRGQIQSSHEFQKMGLDQFEIGVIKQIFRNIPTSWKEFLNQNYYPQEDTGLNIQIIPN